MTMGFQTNKSSQMLDASVENRRIPVIFLRIPENSPAGFSIPVIWGQKIPVRKLATERKNWRELSEGMIAVQCVLVLLVNTVGG